MFYLFSVRHFLGFMFNTQANKQNLNDGDDDDEEEILVACLSSKHIMLILPKYNGSSLDVA